MKNNTYPKDIFDYLLQLINYKILIVINFIIFLFITYLITLLMPKWYKAEVVLMPPKKDFSFGISAIAGAVPFSPLNLGAADEETSKYIAILESNTILRKIVKKKNIRKIYEEKYIEDAISTLAENTNVLLSNEGTIQIEVYAKNPVRSAEIANLYAFYLDSLYTKYETQKAYHNRVFLENQLDDVKTKLKEIEINLRNFQVKYGTIALPEQIEESIRAAGVLIEQKFALQIELSMKEKNFSPTHSEMSKLKQNIEAIDSKLRDIEQSDRAVENVILPFKKLPTLSLQYARLLRDMEIQNKLFGILYQQFQQSKLEEAKDTPNVQVLDVALPPIKKFKPKRLLTSIVSSISTTIILIILLLIRIHVAFLEKTDNERHQKITRLFSRLIILKR